MIAWSVRLVGKCQNRESRLEEWKKHRRTAGMAEYPNRSFIILFLKSRARATMPSMVVAAPQVVGVIGCQQPERGHDLTFP